MIREHLSAADLAPLARAAAGPRRTLAGVARLTGGSKKGAYRLTYDDDSTAIASVWSPEEDYWDHTCPTGSRWRAWPRTSWASVSSPSPVTPAGGPSFLR
ncbi:hypothetical protein ACIBVL_36610 [Streptomyces sp. NPDC049687]|uniref:hypothetical protein n=1 Tax=Streptomyces sp. NPDC049687 TaxID=3365596 RepID=UPI0037B12EE8